MAPRSSTGGSATKDKSPATAGAKKRVRVVEGDSSSAKKSASAAPAVTRSQDADAAGGDDDGETDKKQKKKKKTVEKKDLRDKAKDLSSIEKISSKDAPVPTKGALKKRALEQEEEDAEEEADEDDEDGEEEEEIDFLKGFEDSGDDEDSSDEDQDDDGEEDAPFKVEALPKIKGKGERVVEKKLEKADKKKNAKTGTVYLGRIPHGFHEEQMRSYFSQFGEVTRLRLSRNKKTGASKHYAFIEFKYASVAQIVQETMDNYLLSGHILVCKIVPDDEIHPKMWIGANRRFRVVPKGRKEQLRRKAPKSEAQQAAISKRLLKQENAKRQQLEKLGIDYDFSGYAQKAVDSTEVKVTPVKGKPAEGKKQAKASSAKKEKTASAKEPAKKKARKSM